MHSTSCWGIVPRALLAWCPDQRGGWDSRALRKRRASPCDHLSMEATGLKSWVGEWTVDSPRRASFCASRCESVLIFPKSENEQEGLVCTPLAQSSERARHKARGGQCQQIDGKKKKSLVVGTQSWSFLFGRHAGHVGPLDRAACVPCVRGRKQIQTGSGSPCPHSHSLLCSWLPLSALSEACFARTM